MTPFFTRRLVIYIALLPLLLFCTRRSYAQLSAIPLTSSSYNADVIAESGTNPVTVTSSSFDQATNGYLYYSAAFRVANSSKLTFGGLPDNRTVINGLDTFKLNSYSSNNCLLFLGQNSVGPAKSMHLTTPGRYGKLSLLAACGYGLVASYADAFVSVTLHFTDNSTRSYGNIVVIDWMNGNPYFINGLGRILRSSSFSQGADNSNARMYRYDIILNAADRAKYVDRVDLVFNIVNGSTTVGFFGLSGIEADLYVVLPEEIGILRGVYESNGNKVVLTWSGDDSSPAGASVYEVQRSTNDADFSPVAGIKASDEPGTNPYSWPDVSVVPGARYAYRIKKTSGNGSAVYSNIIQVQTDGAPSSGFGILPSAGTIQVLPSAAIRGSGRSIRYQVVSMAGQLCRSGVEPAGNSFLIDTHVLVPGIYMVRLSDGKQNQTLKFLKR